MAWVWLLSTCAESYFVLCHWWPWKFSRVENFPMASEDDKIDLSSVAVTDLRKSLETLCQGSALPPYNYDFPERFVQQRVLHFAHFSFTRIDGLNFFRESEYSGKSCPRFEKKEVTVTLDFVVNGRWLWFVPGQPSVSQSSDVTSVSQVDEVKSNGASTTNDSDASQKSLSTPGDISLASILQAMQGMETRIGTRFDSVEGRMATKDDLDLSEKKMQNMMHNKITNFATSIQRQLTAIEERLDARIDNLASDHNQLVSNVSVLSNRVDKVTTGAGDSLHTTITDSTGAAFSSVAVVPSETGNDNAPLRTSGDYAPPPVRHLLHSTMVSARARVRYTSETVPTPSHKSPFFHWKIWIIFLIFLVPEITFVKVMCVNQLAMCLVAMARLIMGCIDPMGVMNLFHMHHLFRLKIWTWFKIQILIAHSQIHFLKHLVHQRHMLVLIVLVSIIHMVIHLWEWKNRLLKCQLLILNQITGQLSFRILKMLWMKRVGRARKSLNWNFDSLVIPKKFSGLYLYLFKAIMKLWKRFFLN